MTAKRQHGNIFLLVRCVLVTPASGQISAHAILQAKTILKKVSFLTYSIQTRMSFTGSY